MNPLKKYINGIYSCSLIDLKDKKWHLKSGIPNESGWYFISTNAPLSVLQNQVLWKKKYIQKKNVKTKNVGNYNIQERALRYSPDLQIYWNTKDVYSGMASKLRDRAKEHTFPDPGTGGLALSKYNGGD
jgi:hypothetical protein